MSEQAASTEGALAHISNDLQRLHPLPEHSLAVAELAASFATPFDSASWARLAGLWHDLGKYQEDFQRYIRSVSGFDAHIETAPGKVKHAIAGALLAAETRAGSGRLLAYLIAGHHAGLPDWEPGDAGGAALSQELQTAGATLAKTRAGGAPAAILQPEIALTPPPISAKEDLHFWLRMLYSCLVDADFLDTERFMDQAQASLRGNYPDIAKLSTAYDAYMAEQFPLADTEVKQLRSEIRAACLAHADDAPGLFSLTVPTGGGKTLASLGFALRHAARHGLRRVIYVIPYTSIIEQTADVFRRVFADIAPLPVIEHHSNLEVAHETPHSRLASENWDAPIIVTTNVQFFESLYAAKSSRCRKLHNLCDSVVILDEAQLLPPEHLAPVLAGLRQLLAHYRVSIVLSTATQPELGNNRCDPFGRVVLAGLGEARELAPDPLHLYRQLERVSIAWPVAGERRTWPELAAELAAGDQVLAIVNRRDDAAALWQAVHRHHPQSSFHLSARMCGAHRAEVLTVIKQRLRDGLPVHLVSTQLVEAGVDVDFPVVYRAMAGLDSIAQAAGRCNREGRLPGKGRVVVFQPPQASPKGLLLKAEQAAERVLLGRADNALTPALFSAYFEQFYGDVDSHDKEGVLSLLTRDAAAGQIQFRSAAEKFRLIPGQGQREVLVLWGEGGALLATLKAAGPHRQLMRRLQRHSVTLYQYQWQKLLVAGDLELHNDFIIQRSAALYHPVLGLLPEVPDYAPSALLG